MLINLSSAGSQWRGVACGSQKRLIRHTCPGAARSARPGFSLRWGFSAESIMEASVLSDGKSFRTFVQLSNGLLSRKPNSELGTDPEIDSSAQLPGQWRCSHVIRRLRKPMGIGDRLRNWAACRSCFLSGPNLRGLPHVVAAPPRLPGTQEFARKHRIGDRP